MRITKQFLMEGRTLNGAWTKTQLAIIGVAWPPRRDWMRAVVGAEITNDEAHHFLMAGTGRSSVEIQKPVAEKSAPAIPAPPSSLEVTPVAGALIEAWFDGACEPNNPGGHAGWGILLKVNGTVIAARGGYVGYGPGMSNNVAEYAGVIAVLEEIEKRKLGGTVILRGDSQLVIRQLSGRWRVKAGLYLPYYEIAKAWLDDVRHTAVNVRFEWIPRERNMECDQLSKEGLRQRNVKFQLQPESKAAAAGR